MLRIDEAERAAAVACARLREGQTAIKALKWLREHGRDVKLRLTSEEASACLGHSEALAYLNGALFHSGVDLVGAAERAAQRDMDSALGAAQR